MEPQPHKRTILSFKYAGQGIAAAIRKETNIKIHLVIAILVVVFGLILNISLNDWVKIIILIGLVISLELTNTAIEVVVDSLTSRQHPGAKMAKDVAAGAVLVIAIAAAIVGALIFFPYL